MNWKGIDFENRPVHLVKDGGEQNKPEYKKLNPAGMVPTLEINGEVMTESMPICEYLEEEYPDSNLLPKDPHERF